MLTRLLEKYKEIEASAQNTDLRNDKLDILAQILLFDKLLETLKNEDQKLLTFFSDESIFTEIECFCFGFNYDFSFSTDLIHQNQNEIRNLLSLKCFEVLTNIPSSFYSDLLPSSLKFNDICSNLLLHNIKCYILKICNEIIKNNIEFNTSNIKFLDTHFFGFFSQIIFKIMKWNFPIFFMPDMYKQKIIERNEQYNKNKEDLFKLDQNYQIINDQINIQIDDNIDISETINNLNKIIDKFGLYLTLNAIHDQKQSKTIISISQNITDSFFPNFKYISNLIICNIHNNYAMQEFLVDILKNYPEALPDGTIIKRLSQIASDSFIGININDNFHNNINNNNNNDTNHDISCKDTENNNETHNCENCCNSTNQFDFDFTFNKLKNYFCDRYDACYTLVDIYRSLPKESPIFYQFLDSTVLNNIIKAASIIYEEEMNSTNSFKHTALTVGLIEIVTKMANNNTKLLSSIDLPTNLIITEGNVNEVTISSIELYLKLNSLNQNEPSKSTTSTNKSSNNNNNNQINRRNSPTHHSFNSNTDNISVFQMQSRNVAKSKSESKSIDNSKYETECKLFKLFFTSEKLQNKLITLFFNNANSSKSNSLNNKSLIQSSSTNCINLYDSACSFSFPTSNSTSNSFRYQTGFDCSYPRSASSGWQSEKNDQSNEHYLLAAIASVPGLIQGLESAFEKDRLIRFRLSPSKNKLNQNISSSTTSNPDFSGSSSFETIPISTTSNDSSSMIISSSYDTLDGSSSSSNLNGAPKWTPACKFLALELTKLNDAEFSVPEIEARKWKNVITPAINRFNSILESNYGYNDSIISRHRSCSMNDKLPTNSNSSSFGIPKPFNSSSFSKNNSAISNDQIENRINSFEKVKFSSNFLNLHDEDDSIPIINKNVIENNNTNNANDHAHGFFDIGDDIDDNLAEPTEVEINNDNFETDIMKKLDDCKSESHKNYPHSLNMHENNCFATLPKNSIAHAPKSPGFSRYPIPPLSSSSQTSSSDSSTSLSSIKMSTQQTLIQKKKDTKKEQPPPAPPVSSSNSEGDDEYIIDI